MMVIEIDGKVSGNSRRDEDEVERTIHVGSYQRMASGRVRGRWCFQLIRMGWSPAKARDMRVISWKLAGV